MLDDSITSGKIEDSHVKSDNNPDKLEYSDYSVQLGVYEQSYGERSFTYDSDSMTNKYNRRITKPVEILEQTEIVITESSEGSEL